jgi:hypothetical protein
MSSRITDDDIGKRVVNASGDEVGMVVDVDHGTAHVEPDPGLTDSIKATLGWGDGDEDTYPLQEAAVNRVTDDEIHLETGAGTTGTETGPDRGIDRDEDDISGRDDEQAIRDDDDDELLDDDGRIDGDGRPEGDTKR